MKKRNNGGFVMLPILVAGALMLGWYGWECHKNHKAATQIGRTK